MSRRPPYGRPEISRLLKVDHSMLHLRMKMGLGGCTACSQNTDTDAGEGRQEFMGAVDYTKSGYPDLGVHTSPFEPLSYLLSPQGRRRFVRQLQRHSRGLWRLGSIVARVGRGTRDSSAACSGVCRTLGRVRRS